MLAPITDFKTARPGESTCSVWGHRLLGAAAAAVLLSVLVGTLVAAFRPNFDNSTGCLFAISHDLLYDGVFYRPPAGPLGFGGTRYFPLYPVLLALLKAAGLSYPAAALLINFLSTAAIAAGVAGILRRLGVERGLVWIFSLLAIGSQSALYVLMALRLDLLPVAFAVWGVRYALDAAENHRRSSLSLAAFFFMGAFAAKMTSIFWPLAVFSFLLLNGKRRLAWQLAAVFAAGAALLILLTEAASDGRFVAILRMTASGGATLRWAMRAPYTFLRHLRTDDLLCFLAIATAVVMLTRNKTPLLRDLPAFLLVFICFMTVLIFASPGTVGNHFIDIQVAAVIVLACNRGWLRSRFNLVPLVVVLCFAQVRRAYIEVYWRSEENDRSKETVEYLRQIPGPVLSENPALAISADKHVYLADGFMLRILRQRLPTIDERLRSELKRNFYSAVVVTWRGKPAWWDTMGVEGPLIEVLKKDYVRERTFGRYTIFRPRNSGDPLK